MVSINNKAQTSFLTNQLNKTQQNLKNSFDRLASGKRINKAVDDAAGLAIANALAADQVTLNRAQANISDGQSLIDIQSGAFNELQNIESRRAELAAQASNGTLSDAQRQTLDAEYQALGQEAQRIVASTEFNGQNVFGSGETSIQVGIDSSENSQIDISTGDLSFLNSSDSIATQADAQQALDNSTTRIEELSSQAGDLGAVQNRLQFASENAATQEEVSAAAESRIRDVDIADETANLTANRIKQNIVTAIQAQANQEASTVAKLLQ